MSIFDENTTATVEGVEELLEGLTEKQLLRLLILITYEKTYGSFTKNNKELKKLAKR